MFGWGILVVRVIDWKCHNVEPTNFALAVRRILLMFALGYSSKAILLVSSALD